MPISEGRDSKVMDKRWMERKICTSRLDFFHVNGSAGLRTYSELFETAGSD